MALRLLLHLGCAGTRWVLQELEHRQRRKSRCRELLISAGPMACTSFHITCGFKQPPAFAQDSGLIHHPPVVKGKESLDCPVLPPMLWVQTPIAPAWRALGAGRRGWDEGLPHSPL